jgi:catechol 2,3-dioxygenase-like lactoylglutathione lyase family enzyme
VKLSHLALSVSDQHRSIGFYATYFGFDRSSARLYPDGVIIVRNADGFALALGPSNGPERIPAFPHFGFHADSPGDVRRLRARLVAHGIQFVEDEESETYVGFKCLDPDGHVVEVAWEPGAQPG